MTADGQRILILSIGPVQEFVEQARRTRDLWAGSFLLSWLTGHAMKVVVDGGGTIKIPAVDRDSMFLAITDPTIEETPFIGSLPNLFTAEIPDDFASNDCKEAVQKEWTALGDEVWRKFVAPVAGRALGGETSLRALWDAQMEAFWSIVWVTVPAGTATGDALADAGRYLAMRKAWRSHLPLDETTIKGRGQGGDHCHMMGDWLELSGWVRSIPEEREKQTAFWEALRNETKTKPEDSDTLELAEGERLCAIALVKRLFPVCPKVLRSAIGWVPGEQPDGISIRHWPSTRYMAALPWMQIAGKTQAAKTYEAFVNAEKPVYRNYVAERHAFKLLGADLGFLEPLDGSLFYKTALENERGFPIMVMDKEKAKFCTADEVRKRLLAAHKALIDGVENETGLGEPSPYYALLLMDGDSCGALIQELGAEVVTALFNAFTGKVAGIVKRYHGACIYAGGDDVLAMLPLTTALACARDLREAYREAARCVAEEKAEPDLAARGTISAAIVFAEATVPLRLGLERVRTGLKDRAKGMNGRNSLSVEILQPGGMSRTWVSSWESQGVAALMDLLVRLATRRGEVLSSRFLYVLGTRYEAALLPLVEAEGSGVTRGDLLKILIKELTDNASFKKEEAEGVRALMTLFLDALQQQHGLDVGRRTINADTGPMLRFLANQWPKPKSNSTADRPEEVTHA